MKLREFHTSQKENTKEDNYANIKILLSLTFIIILSYLIEKLLRNTFVKTFYLLIILIFIISFMILNFSSTSSFITQIKNYFSSNFNANPKKSKFKFNQEKFDKVKSIYESGYMFNKMNNNYETQNQMFNQQVPNFNNYNYNNNIFNKSKNDDILANKISNINKINNEPLINSFNKNFSNGYNNESTINFESSNYDLNNNFLISKNNNLNELSGTKKYTNLPTSELRKSNYSESRFLNNINNNSKIKEQKQDKEIISSPFNKKTRLPPSSGSSLGNFNLLSTNNLNKNSEPKFISDFQYTNPINKISINPDFEDNIYGKQIKIIPKNKEVSYAKYQNLKSRYTNTQELNQNNNQLKYNVDKIPSELAFINYSSWIIRMKNFISRNLIPNILSKHDENLSNLNLILAPLGLKLISTLPEIDVGGDFLKIFNERIYFINSNKIDINFDINKDKLNNILYNKAKNFCNDNLFFLNKNSRDDDINTSNNKFNSNMSMFPSLMNFNDYLNEQNDKNNKFNPENRLKKIFFGDTNKIKQILAIVENKINMLEIMKNSESQNSSYYQRQKIIKTINLNNNPFLRNEDIKKIDNYIRNLNNVNNFTLTNLQRLLYERIIINERLYPKELFYKKDESHVLLVIEYSIERLRQLQDNFNLYGNGSRGGDFLTDSWCSLLPTDSQLIAHLIINHIETLYEINNYYQNQQIFLLSYPSNYNILNENDIKDIKKQTPVFLYQINPPEVCPKFNIVYNGNLIPCPLNDTNLFHAFAIYFYLLSSKSPGFVMDLGIHSFVSELLK